MNQFSLKDLDVGTMRVVEVLADQDPEFFNVRLECDITDSDDAVQCLIRMPAGVFNEYTKGLTPWFGVYNFIFEYNFSREQPRPNQEYKTPIERIYPDDK